MPKTIAILYFSGTGNTKAVTRLIGDEFKKKDQVEAIKVEDILKRKVVFDPTRYDLIGLGFPVYGFTAPDNILELVETMAGIRGREFFIYSTCAGPFYLNDIAAAGLKSKLRKKGCAIVYEKQFYMPTNIGIRYPDELAKQLYRAAIVHSRLMVGDIERGVRKVRNDGSFPVLLRALFLIWEKMAWPQVAVDFWVKKTCDLCLKCVRSCPRNNIFVKNDRIRFRFRCLACYRCVYGCPRRAIASRFFNFAILKGEYDIRKIVDDEAIRGDYVTDKTRGYYRVFHDYIFKADEKQVLEKK
jgi:ferredoxin